MKRAKPKPFGVGRSIRVRVHSGPRAGTTDVWRWRADRQLGETRQTIWTGWGTEAQAEAEVMDILRTRGEATVSAEDVRTVSDLMACWAAAQEARSDITPTTAANSLVASNRIAGVIGPVQLDRVDRRVLERFRDTAGDAGSTVARDLKRIRQAWRWGREIGVVPDRDLPSVRVQRADPVYTRYTPTRDEVGRMLSRVSPAVRRALVLLATTGARIGEVTSLRWGAVAADCRSATVDGKTGPRRVQLHPTVVAEVRTWTREADDVLVVGVVDETIRSALADHSPVGHRVSPNGLRRHVVDILYATGQVAEAAAQLGHSPETAIRTYRQVTEAEQRRAVLAAGLSIPGEDAEVISLEEVKRGR